MQRFVLILILLFIGTTATIAQEAVSLCPSPFASNLPDDALSVMSVNQVHVTDTQFANRVRFEHAYNAFKFELQVNQINRQAESLSVDPAIMMANDPLIQQINNENNDPARLGNRVLGELVIDAATWAFAQANEMTVTQEQIDSAIANIYRITEETEEERQALIETINQRLLTNGAPPEQLPVFYCRIALSEAVQREVIDAGDTTLYVNTEHILLSSEAVANDILTLLENGEDFATLATELSLDMPSSPHGGVLGWQPVIFYVPEFADVVADAPLNTVLSPVETRYGWHVIRVIAREERPITDELRPQIESSLFSRWQTEQFSTSNISIDSDWQRFIPEL